VGLIATADGYGAVLILLALGALAGLLWKERRLAYIGKTDNS